MHVLIRRRTEDRNLREIQLATQTSLYVDIAVIILVWVLTLVFRKKKAVLYLMLAAYLILYSFLVYFGRKPFNTRILHLDLFWSYRNAFDGLKIVKLGSARQILLNILVYIPLGLILSAIFRDSKHPILWPVLFGLGLSVITEVVQYITRYGIAEVDDIFDNGLGLGLGIVLFILTEKLLKRKRIE